MASAHPVEPQVLRGAYAAHLVAAAASAALSGGAEIGVAFKRLQGLLKEMHDVNASWGPLYIRHPGSIYRRQTYARGDRA